MKITFEVNSIDELRQAFLAFSPALLNKDFIGTEIHEGQGIKKCANPKCDLLVTFNPEDGNSARREFCSGKCKTAYGRRQKKSSTPSRVEGNSPAANTDALDVKAEVGQASPASKFVANADQPEAPVPDYTLAEVRIAIAKISDRYGILKATQMVRETGADNVSSIPVSKFANVIEKCNRMM